MKLPFAKPRPLFVVLLWFFYLFSAIIASSFSNILASSQPRPSTTYSDIINNSNLVNNISNNTGDSVYSQVASSGHNIYVVWEDNTFSTDAHNYDILFAKSALKHRH